MIDDQDIGPKEPRGAEELGGAMGDDRLCIHPPVARLVAFGALLDHRNERQDLDRGVDGETIEHRRAARDEDASIGCASNERVCEAERAANVAEAERVVRIEHNPRAPAEYGCPGLADKGLNFGEHADQQRATIGPVTEGITSTAYARGDDALSETESLTAWI